MQDGELSVPEPAAPPDRAAVQGDRWVLFDGDNTLWHIETLYDQARQDLVRLVIQPGANADEIEAFQRLEDKRLFMELGYSAERFAMSFEHTMREFVPHSTSEQLQYARQLARSVFERPAEIDPDAERVLRALSGTYRLALVTAGERWVQERRVAGFRYASLFDVVRIVERKTPDVFREVTTSLAINVNESWVVGDSLRSDIVPALDAGLNAILIANHNWIEIERDESRPSHLRVVDRLGDIIPIIVASGTGTPAPARA
jgi:putative hydrolase of the HAD superfamily